MSNHSGSYLLNEIIALLDREQVFQLLGQENGQRLITDIVVLATKKYDCNAGEILEGYEAFGICYSCLSPNDDLQDGLCPKCRV
jgi:hypothetical protein